MAALTEWVDRYHHLGLYRNPFAVEATSEIEPSTSSGFVPRGLGSAPDPSLLLLVQVLGDSGFGKTTHLKHWQLERPGPYHYVPATPYRSRWQALPVESIVYGDEIDRLPLVARRRWFSALARAGATAVIGTHRDLSPGAKRAGLDVVTHALEPVGLHELVRIVRTRIEAAAIDTRAVPEIFDDEELRIVHQHSDGSIRAAEISCHRLVAERANMRGPM